MHRWLAPAVSPAPTPRQRRKESLCCSPSHGFACRGARTINALQSPVTLCYLLRWAVASLEQRRPATRATTFQCYHGEHHSLAQSVKSGRRKPLARRERLGGAATRQRRSTGGRTAAVEFQLPAAPEIVRVAARRQPQCLWKQDEQEAEGTSPGGVPAQAARGRNAPQTAAPSALPLSSSADRELWRRRGPTRLCRPHQIGTDPHCDRQSVPGLRDGRPQGRSRLLSALCRSRPLPTHREHDPPRPLQLRQQCH